MHICLKCKRVIRDISEIENGCSCGSKIFIYKKDQNNNEKDIFFLDFSSSNSNLNDEASIFSKEKNSSQKNSNGYLASNNEDEELLEHNAIWLSKGVVINSLKEGEIENIRQIKKGVFEVNLLSLNQGPLVIKDQDEVYYIRLPFEKQYFSFKHQK